MSSRPARIGLAFFLREHYPPLMDTSAVISGFLQFAGELLAELKRQDIAQIDADLLRLKRDTLREKLEDVKRDLGDAVKKEKGKAEQDLISRGLSNTTIRDSKLRSIEQDANTKLERAVREYNRAIEEIALMEQRLQTNARSWWKRILNR
ncbi:MAG: hypothetical protein JWL69_3114 [Phycisphaerales bacterium]|nr:hypothetical protein [Phycisphaerales bacterium]